jgi:hypothetical protein
LLQSHKAVSSAIGEKQLRRILLVAFHFPPLAGSSGVQRTLSLVRYLPACGWEPLVLSAHPRAFDRTSEDLLAEVPASVPVVRSFAIDTARHLRIFGRYPGALARPDRWRSWLWSAVPAGVQIIERYRPRAIWSTYPIATAHSIGAALCKRSGLPWIADFRDPMAQDGYPTDKKTWRCFKAIEETAAKKASRLVFVTESAMRNYVDRYPNTPRSHFEVIENGYDEALFQTAEQHLDTTPLNPGRLTLLHSGIVYPSERDPASLFAALGRLRAKGVISPENFQLRFRAAVHDSLLQRLAAETSTRELIEVLPPISYAAALKEMIRSDALLVMQGDNCNEQIPAKVYEYLRAQRPMLGLADPAGDTARTLAGFGVQHIAKLEDPDAVEAAMNAFLDALRRGHVSVPSDQAVAAASRTNRTRQLAALLDQVASP